MDSKSVNLLVDMPICTEDIPVEHYHLKLCHLVPYHCCYYSNYYNVR